MTNVKPTFWTSSPPPVGHHRCGACGGGDAVQRGPRTKTAWSGAADGMWLCDGGGWCSEVTNPGRVWVARAARMRELAVGWLELQGWSVTELRRATLAVARAALHYHAGGFVGNFISWAMWREAAAAEWARQGFPARAAATRTRPWRSCGAALRPHTDRVSTAAENEEGVLPRRSWQEAAGGERADDEEEGGAEEEEEPPDFPPASDPASLLEDIYSTIGVRK